MSRGFVLGLFVTVAACSTSTIQEVDVEFDGAQALNEICENIAGDYRADRNANPKRCVGYNENGWPIDGAEIKLPNNW